MLGPERRNIILEMLHEDGHVEISSIADKFSVSNETVRRDLRVLESKGLAKRVHGGAIIEKNITQNKDGEFASEILDEKEPQESPLEMRINERSTEKKRLCKIVAQQIENNDVVYVDNSSTTSFIAQYIPKDIKTTLITNSIYLLWEVAKRPNPNLTLFCVAGFCNQSNFSLYGSRTLESIRDFYPNKAFFSCAGISENGMIADTSLFEIDIKRELMKKTEEVFLLADQSKFGKPAPYFLCDFDEIDYLVTDHNNARELEYIRKKNVNVIEV